MKTFILLATATLVIGASYALNLDKAQPPESRIVNGIEASLTDIPYQVALFVRSINNPSVGAKCGGALISETVVLTAAHCFVDNRPTGNAFFGTNRYGQGTRVTFNRVTVHEEYSTTNQHNDIALVYLDTPVKPNGSTIKIVQLDTTSVAENTTIVVSGYGNIANGVATNKLFYTEMTIRNKKECNIFGSFNDLTICAKGVDGKETCPGDSGGPVVRNWPDNPIHVGIVSFGGGCQTDKPKAFTRTASYIDWIEKNMK